VKSDEEIMEILEAFDLTGSFRAAGELAGCSHHTVEHYVELRGFVRVGHHYGVTIATLCPADVVLEPPLQGGSEWSVCDIASWGLAHQPGP
jgi:hypothetical protein